MNVLDIGMIQVLAGRSRRCEISSDYSLRTAYNLKLIAYFWNFPFNILGPRLTASNKLGKEKLQMRGTICKHFINNLKNDIILSNKTSQVYILLWKRRGWYLVKCNGYRLPPLKRQNHASKVQDTYL